MEKNTVTPSIISKAEKFVVTRKAAEFEIDGSGPIESTFTLFRDDPEPSIYSIFHETKYEYEEEVSKSKHLYRLQPLHDITQSVLSYELLSSSEGIFHNFTGVFGNNASILNILDPYSELTIRSTSIVALSEPKVASIHGHEDKLMIPLIWMPWDRIMMQAYLLPQELPESELLELSEYAMSFVARNEKNMCAILNDINTTIYKEYKYVPQSTTLSTTPFEVFVSKMGVCQDFSNLFICLCRLLSVPARYRVGYLYTGGEYDALRVADQTHAWVEVYLPNLGWMGFDPTNGCLAGKSHIRVACGRYYRDATPTSGVVYADNKVHFKETLSTSVKVIKLSP